MSNRSRQSAYWFRIVLLLLLAPPSLAVAEQPTDSSAGAEIIAGKYRLSAQMVLPHLDEMRRTTEQHTVCFDGSDVSVLFPVFQQPALIGCSLEPTTRSDATSHYELLCASVNGGSGRASLKTSEHGIRAALEAKMGGKNMTFSQFVNARRLSACD